MLASRSVERVGHALCTSLEAPQDGSFEASSHLRRVVSHRLQSADNGHSSSSEQPAGVHHPEQTSIAWSDASSVSIRIPRSPYAALFLFTARKRSDVLTQEWRAAATAAPFVELSRQSRDRPQARRSCARVSASSNPPPGILTGLVDSCSMPGPSSEIAAIR